MQQVEQDIRDIKAAMMAHNQDDKETFETIIKNQEIAHEVHVRNEEVLKQILAQATKTNGRITSLEGAFVNMDKGHALLAQIVSKQNNQYENYVKQREKLDEKKDDVFVTKDEFAPIKNVYNIVLGIVVAGLAGGVLTLIIK